MTRLASVDARISPVRLTSNSGAAVARNASLERAAGRYIAFLDSDDLWFPNKLARQTDFMRETRCWFSYTCYSVVDADSSRVLGQVDTKSANSVSYEDLLKKKSTVGCSTVMLDTHVTGSVQMPLVRTGQDYALWLLLLKTHSGRAFKLSEILSSYRIRPNSISRNKLKKAIRQWEIYRKLENIGALRATVLMFHYGKNAVFRK